jgi:hypothetical protein
VVFALFKAHELLLAVCIAVSRPKRLNIHLSPNRTDLLAGIAEV